MMIPEKLKIGDTIGVVAPSNPIINENVEEIRTIVRNKKIKCLRMSNFSYARKINEKFLTEK